MDVKALKKIVNSLLVLQEKVDSNPLASNVVSEANSKLNSWCTKNNFSLGKQSDSDSAIFEVFSELLYRNIGKYSQ